MSAEALPVMEHLFMASNRISECYYSKQIAVNISQWGINGSTSALVCQIKPLFNRAILNVFHLKPTRPPVEGAFNIPVWPMSAAHALQLKQFTEHLYLKFHPIWKGYWSYHDARTIPTLCPQCPQCSCCPLGLHKGGVGGGGTALSFFFSLHLSLQLYVKHLQLSNPTI